MDRSPGEDLVVHVSGAHQDRTLVVLHGLTDSGTGWPRAVERWSHRWRVLAPDLRGHGRSPRFTDEQLAGHPGEVMVEDVVGLLDLLGTPPVVVAHSLGGAVALTAAVRRPELVRALVLEDPAPRWPAEATVSPDTAAALLEGVRRSQEAQDDDALLAVRRAAHPDWPEDELLATGHAEQDTDTRYLAHADLRPLTPWPELFGEVDVPVLVVTGDGPDGICVTGEMERGIDDLGNPLVHVERLEGAGHCVRRDRPEEFHALVDAFIHEHLDV